MVQTNVKMFKNTLINPALLREYEKNSRTHSKEQIEQIKRSILSVGFTNPVLVRLDNNGIVAGHARVRAAVELGIAEIPCVLIDGLTDNQIKAYIIADNKLALNAGWDFDILKQELEELALDEFDLDLTGFIDSEIDELLKKQQADHELGPGGEYQSLAEKFGVPPFSTISGRTGWWQERKNAWIHGRGIKSGEGRNSNLAGGMNALLKNAHDGADRQITDQTESIFDPVLCELIYRWFSKEYSVIVDPFAGGSVRGLVASFLKREYNGVDLRQEQIDANISQAKTVLSGGYKQPNWYCGDSLDIKKHLNGIKADLIMSCPPYGDLEVYSDNPADLSNMPYERFRAAYFKIIKDSCDILKNDRFACFVVGEFRDKKGNYHNFVADTIQAFLNAGLYFYNEAILLTAITGLQLRTERPFVTSRKLGKAHQNILVFLKGDAKKAAEYCGVCDFGEIAADE